jgi:hypothetical protein
VKKCQRGLDLLHLIPAALFCQRDPAHVAVLSRHLVHDGHDGVERDLAT